MFVNVNKCLLWIRYATVLTLVFAHQLASAQVKDETHERPTPAKVISLVRVPWINLNNSWTNEVNSQCRNDIIRIYESANAGELWALKMLDATSKIPSGILTGNIFDLGMYDECVGIKSGHNSASIQGQHCMISMSIPTKFFTDVSSLLFTQKMSIYNPNANVDFSLTLSTCLPLTCGVEDVNRLANASIHSTPEFVELEVGVSRVICSDVDSAGDLTIGSILVMSFFAMIAGLLLFCTICDVIVRSRGNDVYNESSTLITLAKFSLYTNTLKLASTEIAPGTMPAINGIRFLSTCLVLFLHRSVLTLIKPIVNLSDFNGIRETVLAPYLLITIYMVDTFFIIGGFLTTYLFLKRMQKGGKFNVLTFYLHRYIRLTPCVAASILFSIFIIPHIGSGPLWSLALGRSVEYCRNNWWTNLLYVQNFVNPYEMCLLHTWYLAAEMQLYVISPIILYPLFHRSKVGITILGIFLIASFVTPAVIVVIYHYAFAFNINKTIIEMVEEFFNGYTVTYNRALPYFVGILLGYYVANQKKRLTKLQAAFSWILACVCILYCFLNVNFIMPSSSVYNTIWEALYVSVGRLAWSLAIAWILYACTQGHGGPIAHLLSLPIFVPLGRLSFGMYLTSLIVLVGISSTARTAEYFSPMAVEIAFWGDLAITIMMAFILNVCFETPVIILEEIVRTKRSSSITKSASTAMKGTFSPSRGETSYQTRYKNDGDFSTEMKMLSFWRTMSEVLNNLSKTPVKTPAEWAKKWQEWKSDVKKNESPPAEIHTENVQNETAQVQIEMTRQEEGWLTFLVAVNRGLDDAAVFTESNIAERRNDSFTS